MRPTDSSEIRGQPLDLPVAEAHRVESAAAALFHCGFMRLPVDFGTPRLGLGQRPLGGGAQHRWRRRRRRSPNHGPPDNFISHTITVSLGALPSLWAMTTFIS